MEIAELTGTVTERRRITRNKIYQYLYTASSPRSKQEIASDLLLSLPTVHQNLNELLEAGLVEAAGLQQSTGGRRATGLTIAANARFAVGISLTQNHLRFLAANLRMEEIAYQKTPLHKALQPETLGLLIAAELESFLDRFGLNRQRLLGVGIAVPGIFNTQGDQILLAPTMQLHGVSTALLTAALPYPCFVSNDATAGGYAEWFAQDSRESIAYLSLENGVGGALLLGGAPYHGTNGRSGEFGHICVEPGGLACKCGKRGCLEAYCSAARVSDDLGISLEDFFAGLAARNTTHEALWEDYLQHLAAGVSTIRMVLDCSVVLGGIMTQYLAPYLPRLRELAAAQNPFESSADYIRLCRYPKRATLLGVALHFIQDFIQSL
ncbi:MAG: ROK family transcriptional regulator [Firmicutes bacterium]|nr:ROK family transcriptional regulator [Bacillota bacterium]